MRLTWMSMTKITVENWARGTSKVSSVTSPGQSHISSGMTVLRGAARWRQGGCGRLGEVQTHSKWCLVDCVVVSRYRVSRGGRLLNRTCWIEVFPLLGIAGEEACTRLGTGTSRSRLLAHTLFRPTWHTPAAQFVARTCASPTGESSSLRHHWTWHGLRQGLAEWAVLTLSLETCCPSQPE